IARWTVLGKPEADKEPKQREREREELSCLLLFVNGGYQQSYSFLLFLFPRTPIATVNRALIDDDNNEVDMADPMFEAKKLADNLSLKGTSLFLLGTKCAMKLTVGRLLAEVFNYVFIDSDDVVDQAAGGSAAAKTFRESDEEGFRAAETEVLKQLSAMGRLVISAGDGAVQSSANLVLLRDGISLWMDIPLSIATIGKPPDNPEFLTAYEELRGGYGTADATVSLPRCERDRETDKGKEDDGRSSYTILAQASSCAAQHLEHQNFCRNSYETELPLNG
ncbi:Probable inactive shikimate kinase like 1, chloroplastic, partial [Linum perenne]